MKLLFTLFSFGALLYGANLYWKKFIVGTPTTPPPVTELFESNEQDDSTQEKHKVISKTQMYQWKDEKGVIHYSTEPPKNAIDVKEITVSTAAEPENPVLMHADKKDFRKATGSSYSSYSRSSGGGTAVISKKPRKSAACKRAKKKQFNHRRSSYTDRSSYRKRKERLASSVKSNCR